ncbi:hypothetical protein HMPREF9514_01550 [Enterococcus faecalis TX0855]|nr:hypothetical protein HMPREF9514_01550 [Enterococcus faecalis TX0855]EGG50584.1 hypothetical protein HMPREF9520_03416 [Enterococcus faecalis TX1467]EJU84161.1 hypothetical protein HMPREF1327_03205 [Enterococcus faecalis 599]DAE44931.1 MAG TPA: hypothetical protein [Caudoviricetes sp.]DAU23937.1 MAG TPA: hypothetical protein [Caudoviricetes sp.]
MNFSYYERVLPKTSVTQLSSFVGYLDCFRMKNHQIKYLVARQQIMF